MSLARVLIVDDVLFDIWLEYRDICIFIANYSLSKGFTFSFISSSRIFNYWQHICGDLEPEWALESESLGIKSWLPLI